VDCRSHENAPITRNIYRQRERTHVGRVRHSLSRAIVLRPSGDCKSRVSIVTGAGALPSGAPARLASISRRSPGALVCRWDLWKRRLADDGAIGWVETPEAWADDTSARVSLPVDRHNGGGLHGATDRSDGSYARRATLKSATSPRRLLENLSLRPRCREFPRKFDGRFSNPEPFPHPARHSLAWRPGRQTSIEAAN